MPIWIMTILGYIWAPISWFICKASLKLKLVILGCIAVLCILGYILWENHKISVLERENQDQNLNRQMVNVDILTNQIKNAEVEGNALKANTNASDFNRNTTDKLDSNSFTTTENENRFCTRFCQDSSCAKWRETHPTCH